MFYRVQVDQVNRNKYEGYTQAFINLASESPSFQSLDPQRHSDEEMKNDDRDTDTDLGEQDEKVGFYQIVSFIRFYSF